MKKETNLTPEELDKRNEALTEQLAEAYPDLKVTPYKADTAADKGEG